MNRFQEIPKSNSPQLLSTRKTKIKLQKGARDRIKKVLHFDQN